MTQRGRAAASDSSNDLVLFVPFNCFRFNLGQWYRPIRSSLFIQDGNPTEAPKTQLGRAVVSRALIDHV